MIQSRFTLIFVIMALTRVTTILSKRRLMTPNLNTPKRAKTICSQSKFNKPRYFKDEKGNIISYWHDIPLKTDDGFYNMFVEIPKLTYAKMEVSKDSKYNPIVQDVVDGYPRFYSGPIYWNYGAFPQTWESPHVISDGKTFNSKGDNDPVDAVEIGEVQHPTGSVIEVKVLGALSLIDQNELDWKVIVISKNDPNFNEINTLEDVEKYYKGTVSGIREWFRWYKISEGKNKNRFGHNEQPINSVEARKVIYETHKQYLDLVNGHTENNENFWLNK